MLEFLGNILPVLKEIATLITPVLVIIFGTAGWKMVDEWKKNFEEKNKAELAKKDLEIARLKKEMEDLKEKLKTRDSLEFEDDAYWIKKPDGTKDGPYCSKCYDTEQKTVRMKGGSGERTKKTYFCPNCRHHIGEIYSPIASGNRIKYG
ncbi:hypothetical protein HYR99_33505 [Candidatus Poribacteria bacterium]|nr:hypothetical protein [Candidatus Poribacteria bacterium]